MGKIWLKCTSGKEIHIPVVGDDVNTPDDAVKISVPALTTQGRCLSGTVPVSIPGKGTITFDFTVQGRSGSCRQCGQCCVGCEHLTILPKGIGKVNGTECNIRVDILNQSKGCALFPRKASDVADCPSCGFTFL